MDVNQLVSSAQDAITVRRVFGEPYDKDGVTVIPAARVAGGMGGGGGQEKDGPQGEGGGFGMNATPAGVYVIKGGDVRWIPAVDPQRLVATVGGVVLSLILARGWVRSRAIRASRSAEG